MMELIDLRSDTVTKPSMAMREAMMAAEVGDDVYGEDPTVNRLQEEIAGMFAKEAALFVPSGTMGNEICIKAHTQPGDEIIVESDSHIFVYETGAPSLLAGVQIFPVRGENGMMTAEQVEKSVRRDVYYLPRTRLICIENTHGRSGGSIIPLGEIEKIHAIARSRDIRMHLDGARLWNASVATGIPVREYAKYFDTVSVCFSKGLGAPVGSMIVGSKEKVADALKIRKIFGGGMRQAGVLAAAALYAVEHNIGRLAADHENAKILAEKLSEIGAFDIDPGKVQTNMVIFDVGGTGMNRDHLLNLLKEHGVLLTPEGENSVRAVTHLDLTRSQVLRAAELFGELFG